MTAAPPSSPPSATGDQAVLQEARGFVYRVRNVACLATGTAFAFGGTIITNRHVAAGATGLDLATWDGRDFNASVAGHSDAADLAKVDGRAPESTATLAAGPSDPVRGTAVYVTGYPQGNQLTVTSGSVIGFTTATDLGITGPVLEVSATVQPGNSGSPLLDSSGRLVGVVFARDDLTGDGLAMPLSDLQHFLAAAPDDSAIPCVDS